MLFRGTTLVRSVDLTSSDNGGAERFFLYLKDRFKALLISFHQTLTLYTSILLLLTPIIGYDSWVMILVHP